MELDWWLLHSRMTMPLIAIYALEYIIVRHFIHNEFEVICIDDNN